MRTGSRVVALALLCALAGCGSGPDGRHGHQGSRDDPSGVTELLVVVVENHSLDQMRRDMPATFDLAERFGYATGYTATTHPSLPNYLAIAGGDTFGVTDDGPPAEHPVSGQSVFGQALAAGRTARVYVDGMPSACSLTDGGDRYAVRHNPWTYFVDERAQCRAHDVPLAALADDAASGHLPGAGMVVPNLCHDAHDHDCDLADADAWLDEQLGPVLAGPDFRSGHLAVVVTADEDDHSQDNRVLTVVLQADLSHRVVTTPLTHASLTRLYDEVLGVPPLRGAADAPDMAEAFGLDVPGLATPSAG